MLPRKLCIGRLDSFRDYFSIVYKTTVKCGKSKQAKVQPKQAYSTNDNNNYMIDHQYSVSQSVLSTVHGVSGYRLNKYQLLLYSCESWCTQINAIKLPKSSAERRPSKVLSKLSTDICPDFITLNVYLRGSKLKTLAMNGVKWRHKANIRYLLVQCFETGFQKEVI